MPRAKSMMALGSGGEKTILMATMLSFRSVHVQLDGVAVRVLDIDGGAAAPADDLDPRGLEPLTEGGEAVRRDVDAEVVETAGIGVDAPPDLDEVQQVLAARSF